MSVIWFLWLKPLRNDTQNNENSPFYDKLAITAHRRQNKTLIIAMKIFINRPLAAKLKLLVNKNVTRSANAICIMFFTEFVR